MRIWDLPCEELATGELEAEHLALHALWQRLTGDSPMTPDAEVLRWRNHLRALYQRHEAQVRELHRRGCSDGHQGDGLLDGSVIPHYDDGAAPLVLVPLDEQRASLMPERACAGVKHGA